MNKKMLNIRVKEEKPSRKPIIVPVTVSYESKPKDIELIVQKLEL